MTILAIIFSFYVSVWLALSIAILYFVGLVIMITVHTKKIKKAEKCMLFNMALIVANLNFNRGEMFPEKSLLEMGYRL